MRSKLGLILMLAGFGGAVLSQGVSTAVATGPHAAVLEMDEAIFPATGRFLDRGIEKARDDGAVVLIVTLDTPGGLVDTTRDMVASILDSPIPVVVYVSPQGARAASAGTFITAAAHVAAMSPVSNIGAASPVSAVGDLPADVEAEAKEEVSADIRKIAEARGRNVEALEATVNEAKSYSASEALDNNIIDLIAGDIVDLLAKLDGRTVCIGSGCTVNDGQLEGGSLLVLETIGLETITIEKTLLENFLGFLANPTVTFLLLALGGIGVFIEWVLGAGLLLPGLTGIVALALAFVGLGQLPVNWVGLAIIGLSVVLIMLEIETPATLGFGVVGVVAFAIGGFLLFGDFNLPGFSPQPIEAPEIRVNPWVLIVTTGGLAAVVLVLGRSILAARTPGTSGPSTVTSLVGETGVVHAALAPSGMVHVAGEEWSAVSESGETIDEGAEVVVKEAEGLTLKVSEPSPPSDETADGEDEDEPT